MNSTTDIKILTDELEGTEATFSAWLVAKGDQVKQGQPIAELETDKVAMEVCAAESGIIQSLLAKAGDKIEPEQSLGKIAAVSVARTSKRPTPDDPTEKAVQSNDNKKQSNHGQLNDSGRDSVSPAVRRLILENNLNIDNITGTGKHDRVTRDDVREFIQKGAITLGIKAGSAKVISQSKAAIKTTSPHDMSILTARPLTGKMHPHSNMRKSIASHMVSSLLKTSPHVTSVFEMDMGNIIEHRKWHQKEYQECGVKLTFTAYFLAAMAKAVTRVPQVNAKFHQEALEIFSDVNIGVGTALGGSDLKDTGLVVPVVQQVQSMNLFQIAKALGLQTEKARSGKLTTGDLKNGTLTISNYGVSGSLFAAPIIINQPQVAILGIGKLEKRVVVAQVKGEDAMVIRPKCYVSLTIDHRALDAHQTNLYLSEFVNIIENWGE